tara:strand:+ start:18202 stop:18513 length:312 start_codon:yes stop_codon:yes gene_type:complete
MLYKCQYCEQMSNFTLPNITRVIDTLTTVVECEHCGKGTVLALAIQKPPNQDYRDHDWLDIQYTHHLRTMSEIGEMCGVTPMTIYHWLKKHGIETRKRGQKRL